MDLKIKDVAELLNVSESTIYRWITDGKIPSYQINKHYFFSRPEIENWVISHKISSNHGSHSPSQSLEASHFPQSRRKTGGSKQFGLYRAVHKGGVLHLKEGKTKEEVIRCTMQRVASDLNLDAELMTDLLLDRERLMPTSLNNGIAVPHTRESLLNSHHDAVVVVFLDQPLDYGALDQIPVHTLFFLFACEDKRHLNLLAKIAHLSQLSESHDLFWSKPTKEDFLKHIKEWESHIPNQTE